MGPLTCTNLTSPSLECCCVDVSGCQHCGGTRQTPNRTRPNSANSLQRVAAGLSNKQSRQPQDSGTSHSMSRALSTAPTAAMSGGAAPRACCPPTCSAQSCLASARSPHSSSAAAAHVGRWHRLHAFRSQAGRGRALSSCAVSVHSRQRAQPPPQWQHPLSCPNPPLMKTGAW